MGCPSLSTAKEPVLTDIDESYLDFYQGPESDHFTGTHFFNPWNPKGKKGFKDVIKWRMESTRKIWPEWVEMPLRPALLPHINGVKITYIGHATFLLQLNRINILVDPVFSHRANPFSYAGPKRVTKPFIPLENLPKIDFVFVSHNHYDHMDLPSLAWLARNHQPSVITPLVNPRLIQPCIEKWAIIALDWHQSTPIGSGATLTVTPSQHWSRRGLNDINRDLWGGFVLKTAGGRNIYYCGDSGFHADMFKDIRQRHGIFDLSLIPIGTYEPRWFMSYSHMSPDEAAQVHDILESKQSMGFHFETFQLADEPFEAPRNHLAEALVKRNIDAQKFVAPVPGDFIEFA